MRQCKYLEGENIAPATAAEARALIGKRVEYLRSRDIDHSGRGYYFPRTGVITRAAGRSIEFDDSQDWIHRSSIREMVEKP